MDIRAYERRLEMLERVILDQSIIINQLCQKVENLKVENSDLKEEKNQEQEHKGE